MKKKFSGIILLFVIIIFSCTNTDRKLEVVDATVVSTENTFIARDVVESNGDHQIPVNTQQAFIIDSLASKTPIRNNTNSDWDSRIIKTASLKLEVKDFNSYSQLVYKTVKQLGGYIAQEDQNLTAEKNESVITIKVPVYQFETMMNELPGVDAKVIERKINTDDVSSKIVDTKSRLEAKKEMRLKYLEFLRQSKSIKEVLEVQGEVNSIQEEIEAAAGQVSYLSKQTALSTINLSFFQNTTGYKPPTNELPSFFTRVINAFKSGGIWIADLFVELMMIWPLIILISISIIIWRKARAAKYLSPASNR